MQGAGRQAAPTRARPLELQETWGERRLETALPQGQLSRFARATTGVQLGKRINAEARFGQRAYSWAGCAPELVLGALQWEMSMPLIRRERDVDGVRLEDCKTCIVVGSGAAHGCGDPGRFPSAPG